MNTNKTPERYIGKVSHKTQIKERHLYCLKDSQNLFKVSNKSWNGQKGVHWTVMAADSSVGYECSEHWKLQQPENAGWQVLTRRPGQHSGRMGGGVCEAAEKEGPAPRCFGTPWMPAEGCHVRTFLHYWGSDCGKNGKMSYLCPNLNGTEKDTAPWGPELGESPGPEAVLEPNLPWTCSGMHSWGPATAR